MNYTKSGLALAVALGLSITTPVSAATLDEIAARLEALERENAMLHKEVEILKKEKATTGASATVVTAKPVTQFATASGEAIVDTQQVAEAKANDPHQPKVGLRGTLEFVHATTSIGDTGFVTDAPVSSGAINGPRINNDLEADAAYRAAVAYDIGDDREVQLAYTHLSESQSKSVAGNFLWATTGTADLTSNFENYTGTASSSIDVSYDRIDLLMSEPLKWSDLQLSLLYGLEYARINVDQNYVFTRAAATGIVDGSSETTGIGPQLGFDLNYKLFKHGGTIPGRLSLTGQSTASLLWANTNSTASNILSGTSIFNVSNGGTRHIVPAFHMRLGLNYDAYIAHMLASIEAGYQFDSYINGTTGTVNPDDVADGLVNVNYGNFDMSGPYISANIKF